MNALLILLGMFSLTLVISNLKFLKKANAFSLLSLPLVLGIIFSPDGLIPMLPSTRDNLGWALKVALTWVTFLAGTRLTETTPSWEQIKKLMPFFAGYLFFLLSTLFFLNLFSFPGNPQEVIAVALILSAAIFSSKENPFLLSILFLSLFFLLDQGPYVFKVTDLIYPLGVGLILGVVCRLIIEPNQSLDTPARLTLLGLSVLGTGWAIGMKALEVLVGLSFGWAMAFVHKYGICKDPKLMATEAPIRFVVPLFAGLYIDLRQDVILLGVLLVLLRFIVKWCILSIGLRRASSFEVLTQMVPISHLALPITLSLHLSPFSNERTLFVLSAFCVGYIVNDLMALFFESVKRRSDRMYEDQSGVVT